MQILLSLISILGGKPASATYVSWKCCETWSSSKKSSYFRLKSKSYLINNQELTPFSLDINLKMFFHTVRGFFNSHYIFQLLKSSVEFESGKQLCWKRKPITPFRLSEILYGFNYPNTEDNAERRKYKISDPGINFPCESTERRRWSWCCLFHWSIVSKIDFISLNLET